MLQEETAARKSHWRRVKQKEAELMEVERKLANQIFFNFEHLKMNSVKKQLATMQGVSMHTSQNQITSAHFSICRLVVFQGPRWINKDLMLQYCEYKPGRSLQRSW